MERDTTPDAIEQLARNLFRRDHPERPWRGACEIDHECATVEERSLYREFALAQLAERESIAPFRGAFQLDGRITARLMR